MYNKYKIFNYNKRMSTLLLQLNFQKKKDLSIDILLKIFKDIINVINKKEIKKSKKVFMKYKIKSKKTL